MDVSMLSVDPDNSMSGNLIVSPETVSVDNKQITVLKSTTTSRRGSITEVTPKHQNFNFANMSPETPKPSPQSLNFRDIFYKPDTPLNQAATPSQKSVTPSQKSVNKSITPTASQRPKYFYKCSQCESQSNSVIELAIHLYEHKTEEYHSCPECGDEFNDVEEFKIHLNRCKLTTCPLCMFKTSRNNLNRHVLSHNKNLKCQYCDKAFHRNDNLKKHESRNGACIEEIKIASPDVGPNTRHKGSSK